MKISYITRYNALDVHNWSGLGHFIAKSLEDQQAEIKYIGNLKFNPSLKLKMKPQIYRLLGRNFSVERDPSMGQQYAGQIKALLDPGTDIIFSPGTIPIAYLNSTKPTVFYTDACFAGMLDFYDSFSNLCKETISNGNFIEQKALDNSKLAIYASDWAAKSAIDNYKVDPAKVKVVPFGANIEGQRDTATVKNFIDNRSDKECNLLFAGVDWNRKGGDFAVKVTELLNRSGLKATLNVVGIDKLPTVTSDYVVNHGFISKSTDEGRAKLDKLFAESHFLLLPTRAEAYGLVFCEANSFGVPCIAPAIGGIPTIIKDDINGKLFPLSANETAYAEYIMTVFTNKTTYKDLCYSSFNEYRQRLNWTAAGRAIMNLLKEL